MSSYFALALRPPHATLERAYFIDDFLGPRQYGVRFDDGVVYQSVDVDPYFAAARIENKPITIGSRTAPYLAIARSHGVAYGDVLLLAEALAKSGWTPHHEAAIARINQMHRLDRLTLIARVHYAIAEFRRIQQEGW